MSSEAAAGGSTTVIETVEFRATAPATRLPGLENAQRKLEALSAAIKQVQSQLAGIGTNSMFKLSPQQYANFAYDKEGKLSAGVGMVARRAGFGPEAVKDIRQSANRMVSEVHAAIGKIEREIARNPGFKKRALEARQQQIQDLKNFLPFTGTKGNPASSFKGSGVAGMFFGGGLADKLPKLPKGFSFSGPTRAFIERGYAGEALANQNHFKDVLRGLLSGSVHDNGPAFQSPASVAAQVAQAINQAKADSGKAENRKQRSEAGGQKPEAGKKGKSGGGGGGKGGGGDEEERVLEPKGGPIVEQRVEESPGAPDRTTTTRRQGPYATQAALEQEGVVLKLTSREMTEQQTAATLRQNLTTLRKKFDRDLPHARENGGTVEQLRARFKQTANEMFAGHELHEPMRDQFINETMPAAEQKEMARVGEQRKKLLKQRYLAEQKDDQLKRANIQAELDSLEDHRKALGKFNQSGQRASKDIAREQKKTAAFTQKQQTQSLFNTTTTQGAMDAETDLQRRGAKLEKENHDLLTGRRTGATYRMMENGMLNKYRVDYNKEGDATARLTSSVPAVKKTHDRLDQALEGLTARNMMANLVKVTAWSAAVMVLYKSAELAGYSMRRLEQTGMEMAHLGVVFRGVGGTVQELTTDMLRLASVEGRATSETMESAQSWARLGGDRKAINEEVRVSAEAANIANMHMAETSKQLQSLMHIYHLEAADLDGTLGSLVSTSLKYNVTLEEMFTGLDRSAAAARVAGLSLAELQGMIAVVVGTTGATGSTTGNALKYIFQELNKSEVQQTLRERYQVETLDDHLNQKPAGQTLGDLAGVWGTLGDRSKQMLGGTLGGRFNAARVPVVIEEYPQILKLAIDAQLGLNSAQTANAKILDTVKANMAGLRAEYDRLIMSGNVLSKVNFGAAMARNLMHDAANLFGGPAPSDAEVKQKRDLMKARINSHPLLSQAAGIGSTWLRGWGLGGLVKNEPGMGDYYNLQHEPPPPPTSASKLDDLRKEERASALRAQSFGIARTMLGNGTMTAGNANVFAETMREMGPAGMTNATAFLNARAANNTPAALAAVTAAGAQAFAAKKDALDKKQQVLSADRKKLQGQDAANEAVLTAKEEQHQDVQVETAERDNLHRALEQNKDDVNSLDGAYQELAGDIASVQVEQQKYLDLLKTQEGLMAGIEERFKMVEAHSPAQKLAQDIASLTAQQAAAHQAIAAYDATGDQTTEGLATRAQLVQRDKKLQADLAAAKASGPQADLLTAEHHGVTAAENASRASNYGYDEADKLLRVRKELTEDAARVEEQLGHTVAGTAEAEELTGRLAKDNMLAYEHTLELARRRADVEAEIHQLAIDQNREFSRSFFGSGAADMLRKLAAFKLALGGGVSQGQMFSMSPAMRQDVGNLTGMNPDMTRLLLERNRLAAPRLGSFASGGYTGNGNPNEIAGVVHKGEYVLSQEDLFHAAHDNLYPRGTRLQPGGGIYRAAGIPLDDFGHGMNPMRVPAQERWLSGWSLGNRAGASQMRIPTQERWLGAWSPGRGTTASPWNARGTSFGSAVSSLSKPAENWINQGWTAARGFISNPSHWANLGMGMAHGAAGLGLTSGLNWAGGKLNPALRHSDTYGGAAFGLFSDAAGGAVAGARGGPMGAAIGAVGGMVAGDVTRAYGDLRDIHRNTVGADAMHQQVDARQQAMLRRQGENPNLGSDFERQMAARREASERSHQSFDAHMAALDERNTASEARDTAREAAARKYRQDHEPHRVSGPIMSSATGRPAPINPATGLPWDSGRGHSVEGRPHPHPAAANIQHPSPNTQHPVAAMPVVRPPVAVAGGGASAVSGDTTAIQNATAALDSLAGAAGRVSMAFAALATRADALFKALPSPGRAGGNGLQFAPSGQNGGWYSGKQS